MTEFDKLLECFGVEPKVCVNLVKFVLENPDRAQTILEQVPSYIYMHSSLENNEEDGYALNLCFITQEEPDSNFENSVWNSHEEFGLNDEMLIQYGEEDWENLKDNVGLLWIEEELNDQSLESLVENTGPLCAFRLTNCYNMLKELHPSMLNGPQADLPIFLNPRKLNVENIAYNVAGMLGAEYDNFQIEFADKTKVWLECRQARVIDRHLSANDQQRPVFCLDTIMTVGEKGRGHGTRIVEALKQTCENNQLDFMVSPCVEDALPYWRKFSWLHYFGPANSEGDLHTFLYQPE